jgi:hypothetical protein
MLCGTGRRRSGPDSFFVGQAHWRGLMHGGDIEKAKPFALNLRQNIRCVFHPRFHEEPEKVRLKMEGVICSNCHGFWVSNAGDRSAECVHRINEDCKRLGVRLRNFGAWPVARYLDTGVEEVHNDREIFLVQGQEVVGRKLRVAFLDVGLAIRGFDRELGMRRWGRLSAGVYPSEDTCMDGMSGQGPRGGP